MTDHKAGMVGFLCPTDQEERPFDYCIHTCADRCKPLPLLLALMSEREKKAGVYSVTEILNPPQQIHLNRKHTSFAPPDSRAFATFGTAWHTVIEGQRGRIASLGMADDWLFEQSFEKEIKTPNGAATLRGTADLYDVKHKKLYDLKTVKAYYVRKKLDDLSWSKENYAWQLNLYRHFIFPEAESLALLCLIKDYSEDVAVNDLLAPVEELEVPIFNDEVVENYVKTTLSYLLLCERDPSVIRGCTDEERWTNNRKGEPKRCLYYCAARDHCPQHQSYLDGRRVR